MLYFARVKETGSFKNFHLILQGWYNLEHSSEFTLEINNYTDVKTVHQRRLENYYDFLNNEQFLKENILN